MLQDDNRALAIPDFRLENDDVVVAVGEVVTTTSGPRAAQLRAFARGDLDLQSDELTCTWWVTVDPSANRRNLRRALVPLLAEIEADGDHLDFAGPLHSPGPEPHISRLRTLGIADAVCDPRPRQGPGRVIGHPPGIGGPPELDWDGFHNWLDTYLCGDMCLRKRDKLLRSTKVEARHLFVGVTWSAPWAVLRALEDDVGDQPPRPPALPDGVTHLWLFGAELPSRCLAWWPDAGWFDTRQSWATA